MTFVLHMNESSFMCCSCIAASFYMSTSSLRNSAAASVETVRSVQAYDRRGIIHRTGHFVKALIPLVPGTVTAMANFPCMPLRVFSSIRARIGTIILPRWLRGVPLGPFSPAF